MQSREQRPQTKIRGTKYEFQKTGEIFDEVMEESVSPKPIEMPTGLRQLDSITYGLHRGHVGVISARPGGGKTSISSQIAWNLAKQGKTVFMFSLEMSRKEILTRIICNEAGIPHEVFFSGVGLTKEMRARAEAVKQTFYKSKLAIFDDVGYRFNDAFEVLKDFTDKPDVAIVDHIQLVDKRGFGGANDAIEAYARQTKEAARMTNCAWLLLSQINRDAEKRRGSPRLENLKGSGALEEIADFVLIGSWDGFNGDDYKMDIAKHRHGKRGEFTVKFEPNFYRFTDPTEAGYRLSVRQPMREHHMDRREKDERPFFEVVV